MVVNFTDIGRADYVANILDPEIGFDMRNLRGLESKELIDRMECLRTCIRSIDKKFFGKRKVEFTKFWLVSAERVEQWENGANGYGIPNSLTTSNNGWAKLGDGISGKGYLFVFAMTWEDNLRNELEKSNSKRRNQICEKICVCKVTNSQLNWCELSGNFPKNISEIKWNKE